LTWQSPRDVRRAGRVDLTQSAIVKALRDIGASVQVLSAVGGGCPDLAAGYRGRSFLLECKTGKEGKLNAMQRDWHAKWAGHVAIVRTPEEAQLAVINGAVPAKECRVMSSEEAARISECF
jgi:hypothetical protein